jgi:hypothetical protein
MHVLICEWQCRPFEGLLIIIVVVIRELCQVSGVRCQVSGVSVSVSVCQCQFCHVNVFSSVHVWPPIIPVVHFPCSSTTGSASSNRNAVHSFPQQVSSRCIFLLLHGRSSVVFHRYHTRRHDKRTIVVHSSKDASN